MKKIFLSHSTCCRYRVYFYSGVNVAQGIPEKTEIDQTVEKCSFRMSDTFAILKTDNAFCRLFNNTNAVSLQEYLEPAAAEKLRAFLERLDLNRQVSYALHMKIRRKQRLVLLYILKAEAKLYNVILFDTMYMGDMVESLIATNRKDSALLSCVKVTYFIYDSVSGRVAVSNTQGIGNPVTFMLENCMLCFAKAIQQKSGLVLENNNNAEIERLYLDLAAGNSDQHYSFLCTDNSTVHIVTRELSASFSAQTQIIGVLGHSNEQECISFGYEITLDGLTGILNKKAITEYATNRIEQEHDVTTLMIIDVDDFKHFNDTYGNSFGDDLLVRFTGVLNSAVGSKGRVGRFGGDEFFVVLEGIHEIGQIREVARNIRLGIQWMYTSEMPDLIVTCTIGIARAPIDGTTFADVCALADKMLYYAKSKGKNCYVHYDPKLHANVSMERIAGTNAGTVGTQQRYMTNMQLEIFEKCFARKTGWFVDVMESVKNLLNIQRISLYACTDGVFSLRILFSQDKRDVRKGAINDTYIGLFGKNTVLVNDNIQMYEAVDSSMHLMYANAGIVSSFELLIKEKETIAGLLCFDRGAPARCWTHEEKYFLTMLCTYFVKYGI